MKDKINPKMKINCGERAHVRTRYSKTDRRVKVTNVFKDGDKEEASFVWENKKREKELKVDIENKRY